MEANGADPVARLDNWFWTPAPPGRDVLSGEIFDDPPPRSWPDGAGFETSNVSVLDLSAVARCQILEFLDVCFDHTGLTSGLGKGESWAARRATIPRRGLLALEPRTSGKVRS